MAVLQTYQADLLKDMDVGEGIGPEAVKELRWATDLALRTTKQMTRSLGHSMAAMAVTKRPQPQPGQSSGCT